MEKNRVTLEELFSGSLLLIPESQQQLTVAQVTAGRHFLNKGGVYIFYTKYHEPLYIGISSNIGRRTKQHLQKDRGNLDLFNYLKSNAGAYISVFYEEDLAYQEIYESYLIRRLKPRYNVAKTDKQKVSCHS